jgi:phage repressor protein C with HTH and peptisase S24 domain
MKYPDDEIPYGADFGIRISGESMEPTIMNDSIVWVKKMDAVDNGDIGIFIYANGAVCKQLYYDNRNVLLKSINPAFEPINVTGDDSLKTVGRVLI